MNFYPSDLIFMIWIGDMIQGNFIGYLEISNFNLQTKIFQKAFNAPKPKSEDVEKSIGRIKKWQTCFL